MLKATLPGAPDFYQGTELWDFSLVDPDNRRPVDYATRTAALAEVERRVERDLPGLAKELAAAWPDPRVKLLVTKQSLAARRRYEALFTHGEYVALETTGELADHLFAFVRRNGDEWAITVVPRHFQSLAHGKQNKNAAAGWQAEWGDAAVVLPAEIGAAWRCELSGQTVETAPNGDTLTLAARELFAVLPVAFLTKTAGTRPAARGLCCEPRCVMTTCI